MSSAADYSPPPSQAWWPSQAGWLEALVQECELLVREKRNCQRKLFIVEKEKEMSEDHLNNNKMAMPTAGRESLELVKTVGTGENLSVQMLTKMVMFYLVACRWFPSIVFPNDRMVLCKHDAHENY